MARHREIYGRKVDEGDWDIRKILKVIELVE
jgi:hypothetical protein